FAFAAPRPNPANSGRATSFTLAVPGSAAPGTRVRLDLYTVTGQRVRTLVDVPAVPGPLHVGWDGADDAGRTVAPGIYLARATMAGENLERKVVRTR
ncbi:MAG: FlgD immunoglobulin-like domain containing protein, partial [Candidatus Eisenbacteria bacterium]